MEIDDFQHYGVAEVSYLLLVDTAIQGVAVGLTALAGERAGELQWSKVIDAVGDSARLLPIAVESGLETCKIQAKDISGIVVTTGPGSFTGLRVGLAYAMGFAAGVESLTSRPMRWLGLSSLSILAAYHAKSLKNQSVFVALGATKSNGYAAHMTKTGEATLLPVQVTDHLAEYKDSQFISIGDWPLLEEAWPNKLTRKFKVSPADASFLTLSSYAEVGLKYWPTKFKASMPAPNYLRKSTVEEKENELQRKTE